MSRFRASAPGKLILMGEHAVVYGRPAVVAAIDPRVTVEAEAGSTSSVRLDLRELDIATEVSWHELIEYARRARVAWNDYRSEPSPESFADIRDRAQLALGPDRREPLAPAHLVLSALGELAGHAGRPLEVGSVRVRSGIPVGSGFGSSAAVAAGVIGAVSACAGMPLEPPDVERLTLEAERRQHGTPSGADQAAVLRGGLVRIDRTVSGLEARPIDVPSRVLERIAVFHSGTPAATTGEVVAAVRELRSRDPRHFEGLLDRMGENVLCFLHELERDEPDLEAIGRSMNDFQECLDRMGVVPPDVREALAAARAQGLAAKISGAGGLSDSGAGSVIAFAVPSAGEVLSVADYPRQRVALAAPGLRVEVLD